MLTLTWACACGMVAAKQPPATAANTMNLYERIKLPQLWSDDVSINFKIHERLIRQHYMPALQRLYGTTRRT